MDESSDLGVVSEVQTALSEPDSTGDIGSPEPHEPQFIQWLKENAVPLIGILSIALIVCALIHYSATVGDRSQTKDLAETINNFIQTIAIVAGGIWAIFTFSKGRQFKESLVPSVSGRIVSIEGFTFIVVSTEIKNVGQSKIKFLLGASTLEVFEYIKTSVSEVITMPDQKLRQFNPLHKDDVYIEPNEIIYGTRFIAIPHPPDLGFRLEFKVISENKRYTWRTACMVEKSSPNVNI